MNKRRSETARCSRFADYFDSTGVSDPLPEEMLAHLTDCATCRELRDTLAWADRLLESTANAYGTPPEPSPGDAEATLRAVRERIEHMRRQ